MLLTRLRNMGRIIGKIIPEYANNSFLGKEYLICCNETILIRNRKHKGLLNVQSEFMYLAPPSAF